MLDLRRYQKQSHKVGEQREAAERTHDPRHPSWTACWLLEEEPTSQTRLGSSVGDGL